MGTGRNKQGGLALKLLNYIASLTLTVALLASIALLVGVPMAAQQLQGLFPGRQWLDGIAALDFFRTPLFTGILVAFCLNLVACCINHLSVTAGLLKTGLSAPDSPEPQVRIAVQDVGVALQAIEAFLTKRFARPSRRRHGPERQYLYAVRGRWAPLAFYLAHLGLLALAVGVIISAAGFHYGIELARGQTMDPLTVVNSRRQRQTLGFGLACEDFQAVTNSAGEVIKHKSTLSIIRDGEKAVTQAVDFSHPLRYNGIDIYQNRFVRTASYARITITAPDGKTVTREVKNGDVFVAPGSTIAIRAVGFKPSALQLIALVPRARLWISTRPSRFSMPQLQGYTFELKNFVSRQVTRLNIISDPAKSIVWYSFLCMVTGFSIMFFVPCRRVWTCVDREAGIGRVTLTGTSTKNPLAMQQLIADLQKEVEELRHDKPDHI